MSKLKMSNDLHQKINSAMLNGNSISKTAEELNISYDKVRSLRNKLVKAGALFPIYKTVKKRKTRRRTAKPVSEIVLSKNVIAFKLVVNGVDINIQNIKSIFVSPELVDIKY